MDNPEITMVGFVFVLQQTPRAVTLEPASEVILPPHFAELLVIELTSVVVKVGGSAVESFDLHPLKKINPKNTQLQIENLITGFIVLILHCLCLLISFSASASFTVGCSGLSIFFFTFGQKKSVNNNCITHQRP